MRSIVFGILFSASLATYSQTNQSKNNWFKTDQITLNLRYGIEQPFFSLADQFGYHFILGGDLEYYFGKSLLFYGVEYHYMFGSIIKNDPLAWIRDDQGNIIGNERDIASINIRQRGNQLLGYFGKALKLNNSNGVLKLAIGLGYLDYKYKFVDDYNTAIQLQDPYNVGFDQKTGGFMIGQRAIYNHINTKGSVNYSIGIFIKEAFTANLRSWNFSQLSTEGKNFDMIFGINFAWGLGFKVNQNASEFEY